MDGAICAAAGPELLEECRTITGGCPVGEAKIVGGYRLPAKCKFHDVFHFLISHLNLL